MWWSHQSLVIYLHGSDGYGWKARTWEVCAWDPDAARAKYSSTENNPIQIAMIVTMSEVIQAPRTNLNGDLGCSDPRGDIMCVCKYLSRRVSEGRDRANMFSRNVLADTRWCDKKFVLHSQENSTAKVCPPRHLAVGVHRRQNNADTALRYP